jgi:hypothetical protein
MKQLIFLLFLLFSRNQMVAQATFLRKNVKIETTDGRIIYAKVIEIQPTFVTIQTGMSRMEKLLQSDIKSIELGQKASVFAAADSIKGGFDNTHYLIISSSDGLQPGEVTIQNVDFVFSRINFGVTSNFSFSAGAVIFPELVGFFVMPKWSFPSANGRNTTSVSLLGFKYLARYGESLDETVTYIGYIDHTVKWPKAQITFGIGYGKATGTWLTTPVPTLSGLFRISKKWCGVSESWVFYVSSKDPIVVSGMAIRRVGRKTEWSFGVASAYSKVEKAQTPAIPFVGLNVRFGN